MPLLSFIWIEKKKNWNRQNNNNLSEKEKIQKPNPLHWEMNHLAFGFHFSSFEYRLNSWKMVCEWWSRDYEPLFVENRPDIYSFRLVFSFLEFLFFTITIMVVWIAALNKKKELRLPQYYLQRRSKCFHLLFVWPFHFWFWIWDQREFHSSWRFQVVKVRNHLKLQKWWYHLKNWILSVTCKCS